ncbi:acetyl/propionyl/methylcrotonyl-CoA carboxylase subunit alpha [Aureimonas sp. AU12]|uniref:acetyl-CoA carboxylase biotin carboxylase subunit n=1 Tax=Aureimonas sp. AU12 TaxID=1638161 RepID=UPI0007825986|nr:acetyl/propionyl/methylcrotonyl-CoA carboxylase subunit alpha [Aureimonas sp. AU12]
MRKLLIANRGEIACRIIRTARRMGLSTVAVHSDADRDALHVAMADEAVAIGPAPAPESYLRADRIVEAALRTGADAVHPGYGFLSENAAFAEAIEGAGLVFVGPSPAAIRAMGLKDAAKRLMAEAGVPVVPGYHGERQEPDFLAAQADGIGYPVLIKARAGGGGKGIRRVDDPRDFAAALAGAQREALAAFGDAACLVEAYVATPRHIEIQVFGDGRGEAVHLFERDCSLQRRHQKVLEEAPAPGMPGAMRAAMGEAAVRAARAIRYGGAGTVEFIADASDGLRSDRFWFMEMNTRLQVEHPVTEAITGIDLVEWQLRIAAGEPLPLRQDEIAMHGHAFEARLYAEDPANGFLPATGRLRHLRFPTDARIETGVREGDEITPFYDPMIAKIVTHGRDRSQALRRLADALAKTQIEGTITNAGFLRRLTDDPDVVAGSVDTGLIERKLAGLTAPVEPDDWTLAAATLAELGAFEPARETGDPWDAGSNFRLWGRAERTVAWAQADSPLAVAVSATSGTRFSLDLRGGRVDVEARPAIADRPATMTIDGWTRPVQVLRTEAGVTVFGGDGTASFTRPRHSATGVEPASDGRIVSPMPGLVRLVGAEVGAAVRQGDMLAVVEAMKMEHTLRASRDGVISAVFVAVGDQVEAGAGIAELEAIEP